MIARASLFVAACALAAAGCDFRTFDDLSDEAWAQSVGSPDDINSDNFGTGLAGLRGNTTGASFIATSGIPDGVSTLRFDASGGLDASSETFQGGAVGGNADDLAVPAPIADDLASAEGAVAVGLGEDSGTVGRLLVYKDTGLHLSTQVGSAPVQAVGFGAVNNPDNGGVVDLVLSAGNQLFVLGNYAATETNMRTLEGCTIVRDRGYDIAVGEVDSGSTESEILLAMGNSNQDGAGSSVLVIDGATVAAAAADTMDQSCVAGARTALGELVAPGDEPDFGNAIVVANFDGVTGTDVAIGAPSANKVYVYLNVDLAGGAPGAPVEITGPAGSGRFGATLAAGDFDNDGSDELVVGDPQATAEGTTNAGRAYLIASTGNFGTLNELGDADPESDQNFGRALAVVDFGDGNGAVLAVGALKEVFVYFRTQLSGDLRN